MSKINNDRLGYVKDDGSLHSAPMPDSVGEREALMDYIKNNFEENSYPLFIPVYNFSPKGGFALNYLYNVYCKITILKEIYNSKCM